MNRLEDKHAREGQSGSTGQGIGGGQPSSVEDLQVSHNCSARPVRQKVPKSRSRKILVGWAPAGLLLPLAIIALLIYWLRPDPLALVSRGHTLTSEPTATSTPHALIPENQVLVQDGTSIPRDELSTQLSLAQDYVERSEFEAAIDIFGNLASKTNEDPRPEVGWAWALVFDDRAEQALEHARNAVAIEPLDIDTLVVLSHAYAGVQDWERALGMAENAVQLDPESASAHAAVALAYRGLGQSDLATQSAERALALDEQEAEAHRVRGLLYQEVERDLVQAERELQAAVRLQPGLWLRHYELGQLLIDAQDYDAAMIQLHTALSLRDKAEISVAMGWAQFFLGHFDRAQDLASQAQAAGLSDASVYALLAMIAAQQERCSEAQQYAGQALAEDPGYDRALEAQELCSAPEAAPTVTPEAAALSTEPPPALSGLIAFPVWNRQETRYDTYVQSLATGERRLVAPAMHQPVFRPDGQWLALNGEIAQQMNLVVLDLDTGTAHEVTEHIEDGLPAWSPSGEGMVFSSTRHGDKQSRVYVIDVVPLDGARVNGRQLVSDRYEVLGKYPTWTQDGRIVYQGCDYTADPVQCGLYSMLSEPGLHVPQQITAHGDDTAPSTSQDRIAFMSNRDGDWDLYVVNMNGSGLRTLTESEAQDGLPVWSPDGQTIAFVSDRGGVWAIWAVEADGENPRKLFDIGGGGLADDWPSERISWAP